MNKKKIMVCTLVGILVFSLAFSAKTIARFTKKLAPVSQTINATSFDVTTDSTLEDRNANKPGEVISSDTITLKNENDYDVEFIIKLTAENLNETQFIDYLNLTIIDGEIPLEATENQYKIKVLSNTVKAVTAKVEWKTDENGEIDATVIEGGAVKYNYDIVAKQVLASHNDPIPEENENETTPEDPTPVEPIPEDEPSENSPETSILKTFTTEQDIAPWVGITNTNPSQVRVLDNNSMVIKSNVYTELSEYTKLNEGEMLTIKSKVQFTGDNNAEEGFVYSLMMTEDFNIKQNNYTTTIYKKLGSIYIDAEKINNPNAPSAAVAKGNKTSETDFILINEFYKSNGTIYCDIKIADKDGNVIKEWLKNKHSDNDNYKLYTSLNRLVGTSGVRVKGIEITKGVKSA